SDFLSVGGGARPLAMGSAYTAITHDVLSGYWNPAGLSQVQSLEVAYMHSERFSGLVGYDYGAIALPVEGTQGVLALSFFRQGIDGIKNTLQAWDPEQNRPRSQPEDYITEFSATDLAMYISYANAFNDTWHWGLSAKVIHSRLGPFANAWGYSLDVGVQRRGERYLFGLMVSDLTTLMKFWTVDESKLEDLDQFIHPETGQFETMPTGTNEYVKPSVRVGIGRFFDFGDLSLLATADTGLRFEGRSAYYISLGDVSFEPRAGAELGYKELVFIRTGITDILLDDRNTIHVSPTLGAGFRAGSFTFDYGFASFAGISSDLGFTHRISVQVTL
ncbi:PorV/PorQ family protein, partial [Balneolaceae bacterium ANBcel3]|nr:PorV/PorQ family protein [Balneolaceae bacterium ANBcel3]